VNGEWAIVNVCIALLAIDHSPLTIKVPNAQVSDTTGDDICTAACTKIIFFIHYSPLTTTQTSRQVK